MLLNAYQTKSFYKSCLYILFGLICLCLCVPAQTIAKPNEQESEQAKVVEKPQDSFGRETPRGTVQGFMKALANNDTLLASKYLKLSKSDNPNDVVRQFKQALDTGGRLQTDLQISNSPTGDMNDQLLANQDKVGTIITKDITVNLIVERFTAKTGEQYWLFSPETLKAIPEVIENSKPTLVERYTLASLVGKRLFGYDLADMMAVFLLTLTCFFVTYMSVWLFYILLRSVYPVLRKNSFPITDKVILPLAVVIMSLILSEVMVYAGVSVTVREPVNRIKEILSWVALTWLLLRIIDAIFGQAELLSLRKDYKERLSVLALLKKLVKSLLLIFSIIVIFGNLGFDLTTGIAALGVGGLALALGAQKALENLIGSVVVVADRPVRVGDFCKFGTYEGTVIDIGIRSTRVRTLARTIVTIPNGDFSSMQIENFTARDMFLFFHHLFLKRTANIDVIQELIEGLTVFIENHELTNQEWNQVRIAELRQDCYVIEIRAYIDATGGPDFYSKQTSLLVDMLKEIEKYQVEHALPTQRLVMDRDMSAS